MARLQDTADPPQGRVEAGDHAGQAPVPDRQHHPISAPRQPGAEEQGQIPAPPANRRRSRIGTTAQARGSRAGTPRPWLSLRRCLASATASQVLRSIRQTGIGPAGSLSNSPSAPSLSATSESFTRRLFKTPPRTDARKAEAPATPRVTRLSTSPLTTSLVSRPTARVQIAATAPGKRRR